MLCFYEYLNSLKASQNNRRFCPADQKNVTLLIYVTNCK